ncbi:Membrane protein involved in the export of O-antigen and teichoic acid [Methanolobus vulcani]|uniref:Membrane protein involved in the export of O-antigen and teichoic acid n=1 Tax=Methanolobus vulcani TaxID=38026 RepID=A0A7Z7AU73_9EURY|nr:flippase [Methanolobus vulcani]SDF24808.1 Membrane protein involved in the export of O-antigen and teichoic acid [Methanolobus vulcani]
MTTYKKVATNATFILIGNVVVKILALFISVYLARYLGVEQFGDYNFVITYLMFFTFVANFGMDSILIRDLARFPEKTNIMMGNILSIRVITSVFAILMAILLINLLHYSYSIISYISIMTIILLFQGISYLFESLFQANLKMQYSSIGLISSKFIYAIFVFIFIYLHYPIIYFFYGYVAAESIRMILAMFYSKKFINLHFSIDFGMWKYLFKECLPFIAGYALFIIYYRIDILMLSKMVGNTAVGLYSAAYKLTDPLLFLPGALASTMMPVMSKLYHENVSKLNYTYSLGCKYILQLMLPITMGLFLLSDRIIHLLYSADYNYSVITLQILSLTVIFNSINSIQSSLLTSSNRQKMNTISVGICCVINIILNIILIPLYSYNGAAIATLISVILLFISESIFIYKSFSYIPLNKSSFMIILSSVIMGLVLSMLPKINMFLTIIICAVLYLCLLVLFKSISGDDYLMLKSLVKKGK